MYSFYLHKIFLSSNIFLLRATRGARKPISQRLYKRMRVSFIVWPWIRVFSILESSTTNVWNAELV